MTYREWLIGQALSGVGWEKPVNSVYLAEKLVERVDAILKILEKEIR